MEPPEMVPPVKRTLGWVRWGGEVNVEGYAQDFGERGVAAQPGQA